MLFAAPLVAYIPLAALGAVLLVVAWKMAEKSEFLALSAGPARDALVLLSTFLLTVFVDLTPASPSASCLALSCSCIAWRKRSKSRAASSWSPKTRPTSTARAPPTTPTRPTDPDVMVYRISGALFFGATAAVSTVLDRVGAPPKSSCSTSATYR